MIIFLSITVICVTAYLFFLKYVEYFEYKHCLNCPLKKEEVEIDFSVFAEDMKRDKENYLNEKKL